MRAVLAAGLVLALVKADAQDARPRGWLGFTADSGRVLVVRRIAPGSPAEQAGLLPRDTIIRVGREPATWEVLARTSDNARRADSVALEVRRRGGVVQLTLIAGELPAHPPMLVNTRVAVFPLDSAGRLLRGLFDTARTRAGDNYMFFEGADSARVLRDPQSGARIPIDSLISVARQQLGQGMRADSNRPAFAMQMGLRAFAGADLADLDQRLGRYLGVEGGVLILRVNTDTPAARSGLLAGDVVVAAGGRPMQSALELRNVFMTQQAVKLSIVRNKVALEIDFKADKPD